MPSNSKEKWVSAQAVGPARVYSKAELEAFAAARGARLAPWHRRYAPNAGATADRAVTIKPGLRLFLRDGKRAGVG